MHLNGSHDVSWTASRIAETVISAYSNSLRMLIMNCCLLLFQDIAFEIHNLV